jgi:NADH:ubiquinone oxidoreductase subunit E
LRVALWVRVPADPCDRELVQKPLFFETRAHVLVCTSVNCSRAGARRVFEATWRALEERKVAYYRDGGTVRLTESGCQGACGHGPNAIVYFVDASGVMREGYYAGLDAARLLEIAEAVHEGRDPGPANRYGGR